MVLRKQEVRKVEAKAKSSRAVAYDERGKVAKRCDEKTRGDADVLGGKSVARAFCTPPDSDLVKNGGASVEVTGAVRGRPGRKPKQSAEQLLQWRRRCGARGRRHG